MAASSLVVRNAPLFLAALCLGIVAASQGCSPGTLSSPDDFKAEADKYGAGGGGSTPPVGMTGGKTGTGGSGAATGGQPAAGATCGAMNVKAGCDTAMTSLMSAQCTLCHNAAGASTFLTIDFMTDPKGALLGKSALYADKGAAVMGGTCPATREVLLDPNNFDGSLFVTKVRGSGFACGVKMPQVGALTTADRDCILQWACGLIKN